MSPLAPGAVHDVPSARIATLARGGDAIALVLPAGKVRVDRVEWAAEGPASGTARCVNLDTGVVIRAPWRRVDGGLVLDGGLACTVPTLICFSPA